MVPLRGPTPGLFGSLGPLAAKNVWLNWLMMAGGPRGPRNCQLEVGGCEDGHRRAAYQRPELTCRLLTRTGPPQIYCGYCMHVDASVGRTRHVYFDGIYRRTWDIRARR